MVVAEAVVVEDQPVALDEQADARVLGARWRRARRPRRPAGRWWRSGRSPRPPSAGATWAGSGAIGGTVDVAAVGRVGRVVPVPGREELDRAVVEREHALVLGLVPPPRDEPGELVGSLGGQVVCTRSGPPSGGRAPRRRRRRGVLGVWRVTAFHPSDVDRPVAHHLEVLHLLLRSGRRGRRRCSPWRSRRSAAARSRGRRRAR